MGSKPDIEHNRRTILFLDKVLMSRYRKEPRGVEVFNLNLIRDLARLDESVTAGMHATWIDTAEKWFAGSPVELLHASQKSGNISSGLSVASRIMKRKFSVFLLGNVSNRLVLPGLMLRMAGVAPRCVLIAHRPGTRRFLIAQKLWKTEVVAVNERIADSFKKSGFKSVTVRYGVSDADLFVPDTRPAVKNIVDFCVLGHLDNPWKGADTAVAAFKALPADVQNRARLHLASFHHVPDFGVKNITAYPWMPFNQVSDFLRKMDVMIVPSRDSIVTLETFCQSMVQGMLAGLPVIAGDLPILSEKLDHGGGITIRGQEELTGAMRKLAGDPALRLELGHQARAVALERYVWNTKAFVKDFLFPGDL